MAASRILTPTEADAFGAELTALREEVVADLGDKDARHIRGMIRIQRRLALTGRALLWFGFMPPVAIVTWPLGALALGIAKILENMEIGHNVMHGQYDWMQDPKLHSQTYEWDTVCDGDHWRNSHNYEHHTYTNILGKDRDIGYAVLRMSDEQPWRPMYLFQPISNALLAMNFDTGVGLHDVQFERVWSGDMSRAEFKQRFKPFVKKASRMWFKDYVFFPLLSGPNFLGVMAGNAVANLIRNLWAYTIIFCRHFPRGVQVFEYSEEQLKTESKGQWYARQINGSANLEGGRLFHIMSGHLSHQIEHHLFPDLPAHRYAEIGPRVEEICQRYGQLYNTGPLWKQYATVLGKVFKYALPTRSPQPLAA